MPQSLAKIYVHLVFHVKQENVQLPLDGLDDLHAYLGGICRKLESIPVRIGGTYDHVHALFILAKGMALTELVKTLKANSSAWVKDQAERFRNPMLRKFQWQGGYGAFSVSESQLESVREYIANQREHHRQMTFKEEYLAMLKKHHVEYDERFLWE